MGRLRAMAPRLAPLPPRLKRDTDAHGHSPTVEFWRPWYSLKRWKDLRWSVLVRDLFTCQWPCCGKRLASDTSQLVADHKIPHRGDERLFWDEGNLWTLCAPCHNRAKQAEERAAR